MLMDLMKIHAPSGDNTYRGSEVIQPVRGCTDPRKKASANACSQRKLAAKAGASELENHQSLLPSVEEKAEDREDVLPTNSLPNASSAGEFRQQEETYEPLEVFTFHMNDPTAKSKFGSGTDNERKSVDHVVAAQAPHQGQTESRVLQRNADDG